MGWLFGKKKKVPIVPFPEGRPLDEKTLQFPAAPPPQKVINPEELKKAAGVDVQPEIVPEKAGSFDKGKIPAITPPKGPARLLQVPPRQVEEQIFDQSRPLYIKVEVYQRILGEIDSLKESLHYLGTASKSLESSEYNEESNFEKLRKTMKNLHDNLLQIDQSIYKSQGD